MTSNFSAGDIIQGEKRGKDESFHPIIYLEEIDAVFFKGGMITHASQYENIGLRDEHFSHKIDSYPRPSFFVGNFLIKKQDWGPFTKIAQLSDSGLAFLRSKLDGTSPVLWEDYISLCHE